MANNGFTPTQQAILDVLSDGEGHSTRELHGCLPDELTDLKQVRGHIFNLRKKLRPEGQDILCVMQMGRFYYRWVRLLHPSQRKP